MLIFGTSVKNWSRKVFLTNVSYTFTQLVQVLRPKIAIFSMWWLVMSIFRNRKIFSWRSCFACVLFRSRDTTLLKKISKFTKAILRYGFFNFFRGGGGTKILKCVFFEKNHGNVISGRNGVHL